MKYESKLHFVLVPFMAQGHMIPMIDIARLLADRGVNITLVTTPLNASRMETHVDHIKQSGLPIEFASFAVPCKEVGLPMGCENMDVLPSADHFDRFFEALAMLKQPLLDHLRQHRLPLSCMITDSCHPWTGDVALELDVPRFVFHGMCCFALLCLQIIRRTKLLEYTVGDSNVAVIVPDLYHEIKVTRRQMPDYFGGQTFQYLFRELCEAESTADGVIVNSFYGLEPWYVEEYRKTIGKKSWTIGPVSHCNTDHKSKLSRGSKSSIDEETCMRFLDSMQRNSVVYVSFGSLTRTPPSQIVEIGLGLENTGHPFIWVIQSNDDASSEVERFLSEGYEKRNKSKSLIVRGWAPQVAILSHPAIGGFLTHVGWNSTLEGISAGLPMATWPHFAEQFLNAKLVVEILEIGVDVGVESCISWGNEEESCAVVGREAIGSAVLRLMDGTEEAEERRRRARELGLMAREATKPGGSSHDNLDRLVRHILKPTHPG